MFSISLQTVAQKSEIAFERTPGEKNLPFLLRRRENYRSVSGFHFCSRDRPILAQNFFCIIISFYYFFMLCTQYQTSFKQSFIHIQGTSATYSHEAISTTRTYIIYLFHSKMIVQFYFNKDFVRKSPLPELGFEPTSLQLASSCLVVPKLFCLMDARKIFGKVATSINKLPRDDV